MTQIQNSKQYDFTLYLAAKKTIDDVALNRYVLDTLKANMPEATAQSSLQVLELGSGIGTMVERMVEWGLLKRADYTAVDASEVLAHKACSRLDRWSLDHGFKTNGNPPGGINIKPAAGWISVTFECADVYQYFEQSCGQKRWDLGIAHAFMDLVDPAETIPRFCQLIKPGGLIYLTLNYDGETVLLPVVDQKFDEEIIRIYNESMDNRMIRGKKAGDSRTGRHLLLYLQMAGAEIMAAGSSDWVVFPGSNGYQENETYFLHFIVHTIFKELKGHASVDQRQLETWVAQRHDQIEAGKLIFIAKQMDVLARIPEY
jgi:SAM-dependent methyltransferase